MYPIMLNLKNKSVVVIGGGTVAARKINLLLQEQAKLTVISTSLHPTIAEEKITWIRKKYAPEDLAGAALIFACTNDNELNKQILADAEDSQWVNVVSDKEISEFYNVAIAKVNDLSVTVSTEGKDPMRAKKIRQQLEGYLKEMGL